MKLKIFSSALALAAALFFPSAAVQAQEVQQPVAPVDIQALLSFGDIPQQPLLPSLQTQEGILLDGLHEYEQQLLQSYYSPFATYSLTPEEQAGYLAFIKMFWPWVYNNMEPWEINDEMAAIINTMIEVVADCSQGLASVQILTEFLFDVITGKIPRTAEDWKNFIKEHYDVIAQAFGNMRYNRKYIACINVTAANWRSTFEMAYWNYWW